MSKIKNKDKILISALRLFNKMGCINVRLQHISDDTVISLGNIAYHYNNKEAILQHLYEQWYSDQKSLLQEYRNTPIFVRIDRMLEHFWAHQEKYSFFFYDLLEIKRTFPEIYDKIKSFMKIQTLWMEDILRFNISRSALEVDKGSGQLTALGQHLIHSINFWRSFHAIDEGSNENRKEKFLAYIWWILIPYMTDSGKAEYHVLRNHTIQINY